MTAQNYSDIEAGVVTMQQLVKDLITEIEENHLCNYSGTLKFFNVKMTVAFILKKFAIDVTSEELKKVRVSILIARRNVWENKIQNLKVI